MKYKQLLIALAAVSALAQAADIPGSNPSTSNAASNAGSRWGAGSDRLATARQAIQAKDWNKALSELNTAAREMPSNADVQNLLGYSYRKQATPNLAKAFEHYGNALRLDPRHKGAHEYIGEAYLMDKKPAEAEKHLAQLEALCGNRTCEEYTDLAKAIADYKKAN